MSLWVWPEDKLMDGHLVKAAHLVRQLVSAVLRATGKATSERRILE
jgi:hypothetical protein